MTRHIAALVGGVGGAKLAHGLMQVLPADQLTVIVNTGDDFWHYDLRICPDLDTVMYTLGGWVDPVNGWGVAGDSTVVLDTLRRYGETPWFRLGDRDLATHLLRTTALRRGERLTDITRHLTAALNIPVRILPATDAEAPTRVETREDGLLDFQEYFVRHRWQPTVTRLHYGEPGRRAAISPEVQAALDRADAVIIAPSNPWLSIEPMLALDGMRDALMRRSVPRIAVSPIIGGKAVKGPAAKLMGELGHEVSARAVAGYYGSLITGFVYDRIDADQPPIGVPALSCDTLMPDASARARLARCIYEWIESELR